MTVLNTEQSLRTRFSWGTRRRAPDQSGKRLVVTPAPHCHPPVAGIPISVDVVDWGGAISCRIVRAEKADRDIVVALPEVRRRPTTAERGHRALVGWLGHDRWHEAIAEFVSPMRQGDMFFRLRVKSIPVHRERRAHVRAIINRPIAVFPRGSTVMAATIDISEAAVRVLLKRDDPVDTGEKVQLVLSLSDRGSKELTTLELAGYVYRTRPLCGDLVGKKEAVVLFQGLPTSRLEYLRGLVYRWDIEHRNPAAALN